MAIHKALHLRNDVNNMSQEKEGERELTTIEGTSIRRHESHIKNIVEKLITVTRNNTNKTGINTTRKQKQVENQQ